MGGDKQTTTTSQQETTSQTQGAFSQLQAGPAGALEQYLQGDVRNLYDSIKGLAGGTGVLARRLMPQLESALGQFQGLPSLGTAFGYLQGGATPEQRRALDRMAGTINASGRTAYNARSSALLEAAGRTGAGIGGLSGLSGSFQTAPIAGAAADIANANATLSANEQNVRAGVGGQLFGGALSASEAAMGRLLGITGAISGLNQQSAQLFGFASDLGARSVGMDRQLRLALGRNVSGGTSYGSSDMSGKSVTEQEKGGWSKFMDVAGLGIGAAALIASGGSSGAISGALGASGVGGAGGVPLSPAYLYGRGIEPNTNGVYGPSPYYGG